MSDPDGPVTGAEIAAMARAIALSRRARHVASPNPAVGAVLLRGDDLVGEGWTSAPGGPHAEVRALAAAGDRAVGATAVVTLEPCNHTGRTGPCSVALVHAGVARVVYAAADPSRLAQGGADHLRAQGVQVVGGLLGEWATEVHRAFLHDARTGRPLVRLKLAATRDGTMAVPGRRWVTGSRARRRVHRLRADADAVLVGTGTVLADDPRLDVRDAPAPGGQPRPVWLDRTGRTPLDARVVRPGAVAVVSRSADAEWTAGLRRRDVTVVEVDEEGGRLDLAAVLVELRRLGLTRVLAEPGPVLAEALAGRDLVDELVLHIAPDVAASAAGPTVPSVLWTPGSASVFRPLSTRPLGPDREVVARPR